MKSNMKQKLMILGGSKYILPIINEAHRMDVYTITCDYLPDNIAHKYSDEYCNVSILDKDAVLEKAADLGINGIMSFACDPGVTTAAYVAEKIGLPSVGSYEAVSILQDKGLFRDFLKKNGFNTPNAKRYERAEDVFSDIEFFNWPVIVKPTDSAGSKGVVKVDKPEGLKEAVNVAKEYSHNGAIIVEDFLKQEGFSSDSDCFSVDGKMVFYSFSSQRFDDVAENPYTPAAFSWPSSMSKENIDYLKKEMQRLISLLGLKTSIYNIETRQCVNGKPYIMEFSPRGGGNRLSEVIKMGTGVDLLSSSIKAALGMKIDDIKQKEFEGFWGEIILHSKKPGIFKSLSISREIKENIVERDLWIKKGDKVGGFKGANESVGTLVLKFDSKKRMENVINNIDEYVEVVLEDEIK